MNKKSQLQIQFNSILTNEKDPTLLEGEVIIHGFEKSWNNQIITEEVCLENMNTLVGKRIVCEYITCNENGGVDALTDHAVYLADSRDGMTDLYTNTIAIGFIKEVYIKDYQSSTGESKRALFGKVALWNDDKYRDIIGLLNEWLQRGIKINMSVEYLYKNYQFVDGVEYVLSPIIYTAHALLNSENRGDYELVEPAYDEAEFLSINDKQQWNKAVAQVIKCSENNKVIGKEEEELTTKNAEETIEEVVEEVKDVVDETSEVETVESAEEINKEVETERQASNDEELEKVNNSLVEANKTILELNEKVDKLEERLKAYEEKELEVKTEEKRIEYKEKFDSLGLDEKFESEEVQELVVQSVNSAEAELKLTKILLGTINKEDEGHIVKEMCSKASELVKPAPLSFEERYNL